jgi:cytochrome c oxidase subunit I
LPRRMAFFDFSNPALSPDAIYVSISAAGGIILLLSGVLFLIVLLQGHRTPASDSGPYTFARAFPQPKTVAAPLNGYALWISLMIALTVTNYGFPIAQLASGYGTNVPAVYVGR